MDVIPEDYEDVNHASGDGVNINLVLRMYRWLSPPPQLKDIAQQLEAAIVDLTNHMWNCTEISWYARASVGFIAWDLHMIKMFPDTAAFRQLSHARTISDNTDAQWPCSSRIIGYIPEGRSYEDVDAFVQNIYSKWMGTAVGVMTSVTDDSPMETEQRRTVWGCRYSSSYCQFAPKSHHKQSAQPTVTESQSLGSGLDIFESSLGWCVMPHISCALEMFSIPVGSCFSPRAIEPGRHVLKMGMQ
ncbi:hypothetical protein N0V83_007743 [Neocucurbitaria cava]|uniref:Uncharacterized protein n=1 Tax=Neocucurbitaria cava TaxID=798079 RepID=A0A9W8Y296_9PLEO|nr:hypothetical protein N0V83_007743 [Neocucurbitaria cava]